MKKLIEMENFGAIDADNDQLLIECFEDHEAYKEIIKFNKFLIIGRKGSGKTAIFKILITDKNESQFCYGHTFSDYPWHFHDKQVKLSVPEFDKYTHSWKYLILLSISKILLNQDQSIPFDDISLNNLSKIESFVIDTYGTRDPDITQIFTSSKSLKIKPSLKIDFGFIKSDISLENFPMNELPTIIQEVNKNLIEYIMSCLNPENEYFICFDQLDFGFDPNSPEYKNRLIGLLLAAKELNLHARDNKKKLNIVIFLRDDIYENLHFDDKNKITQNFMSIIEWDSVRSKNTLKTLMEKRFTKLLSSDENEYIKWEDVFDETQKMTGKQNKYQHILDKTYLRPRDVIKFCNETLNEYQFRCLQNSHLTVNKFENIDINKSKINYSDYFLKELDDEIHKHIPHYKDYLDIFKNIGFLQFSMEDYHESYEKKKELFTSINPIDILKQFFNFSIIGYYKTGGSGYGGSEYIFKYKDVKNQFDEQAKTFKIHPGLMEVLELKKYSRTSSETIE